MSVSVTQSPSYCGFGFVLSGTLTSTTNGDVVHATLHLPGSPADVLCTSRMIVVGGFSSWSVIMGCDTNGSLLSLHAGFADCVGLNPGGGCSLTVDLVRAGSTIDSSGEVTGWSWDPLSQSAKLSVYLTSLPGFILL